MGKLRNYPPSVDEVRSPRVDLKKAGAIVERMETQAKMLSTGASMPRLPTRSSPIPNHFPPN